MSSSAGRSPEAPYQASVPCIQVAKHCSPFASLFLGVPLLMGHHSGLGIESVGGQRRSLRCVGSGHSLGDHFRVKRYLRVSDFCLFLQGESQKDELHSFLLQPP